MKEVDRTQGKLNFGLSSDGEEDDGDDSDDEEDGDDEEVGVDRKVYGSAVDNASTVSKKRDANALATTTLASKLRKAV